MKTLVQPERKHVDNNRFAWFLHNHLDDLFTYLRHPGLEATNWRGEPAIRPAVVNRKVWGGKPCNDEFAASGRFSPNVETSRIYNSGLDPQYAALFVVHFDRVFVDPVFYTNTFHTMLQIAGHFPVKFTMETTTHEAHHVTTTKVLHGVIDQQWVNGVEEMPRRQTSRQLRIRFRAWSSNK